MTQFWRVLWPFMLVALCAIAFVDLVPPPGPAHSQFTEQRAWGGTSGGSANAQTAAVSNYALNAGVPVRFRAGFSNTGATTLNVNGTGVQSILRPTIIGMQPLVGGEIIVGQIITVVFEGGDYRMIGDPVRIGSTIETRAATVPLGTLAEDGSCVSRTGATAALFAVIGTTYGVCDGSTTFGLPDSRGRMSVAIDNQGGAGAAGRVTSGGSGCAATAQNVGCGAQNTTLSIAQLPVVTPAGTIAQITPAGTIAQITPTGTVPIDEHGGHSHLVQYNVIINVPAGGGQTAVTAINPGQPVSGNANTNTTGITASFSGNPFTPVFTGTAFTPAFTGTAFGSGSAHALLNPTLTVLRAIKL